MVHANVAELFMDHAPPPQPCLLPRRRSRGSGTKPSSTQRTPWLTLTTNELSGLQLLLYKRKGGGARRGRGDEGARGKGGLASGERGGGRRRGEGEREGGERREKGKGRGRRLATLRYRDFKSQIQIHFSY